MSYYRNNLRKKRRVEARAYVDKIRAETICDRCGAQPIEWHREEHVQKPHNQISKLVGHGYSVKRIAEEIALCRPLCHSCHGQVEVILRRKSYRKLRREG